jgi:hypothetical protein
VNQQAQEKQVSGAHFINMADVPARPEPKPETRGERERTVTVDGYAIKVFISNLSGYATVSLDLPPINKMAGTVVLKLGLYSVRVSDMAQPEVVNEINQCIMRIVDAAKALGVKPQVEAA